MTITCHLEGVPVVKAIVRMSIVGNWRADVWLAAEEAPTGADKLSLYGVAFTGTISRSTVIGGQVRLLMVGGAGGLTKEIGAKNWADGTGLITPRKVILDALAFAGESLSEDSDASLLDQTLTSWQRQEGPVSRSIQAVCDEIGATWRVLRDGTIWIGTDAFDEAETEHVFLDEDWEAGVIEIAPNAPELQPGVTFRGQEIRYVVHYIEASSMRTEACLDSPGGMLDRFLTGIRHEIRYSRSYSCKVVKQNTDGTLDLMPYHRSFQGKGIQRVPIRVGIPGFEIKVSKGARCRVQWDDGSPAKPFVALWDLDASKVDSVDFLPGGLGRSVLRVGDTLECVLPAGTLIMTSVGPATLVAPTPLLAVAMSGNAKLKA